MRKHCDKLVNMRQLTVVISGFDPYEGVDINPAFVVPDTLARNGIEINREDLDDPLHDVELHIHAVHMPVSYTKAWPILHEKLEQVHPQIVIATGLKRAARGILLERCAVNLQDEPRPDADNVIIRREPINTDGPAAYWTGLPLRSILQAFARDQIPATLSSDAGTFVCNTLFYNMQHWVSNQERALGGFVNFSLVNERPHSQHGLPLEQQIIAAADVIRQSARYFLDPRVNTDLL